MKRLLSFALMLLLPAFIMTGCSSDDNNDNSQIELPNPAEQTQQGYADDETTGGFTFTARSAWTATVMYTTPGVRQAMPGPGGASSPSWLRLLYNGEEKYSGEAGQFTLTIELETNYSRETRSATITITSGSGTDKITITVTQKDTKEDGTVPEKPAVIPDKGISSTAEFLQFADAVRSGEDSLILANWADADGVVHLIADIDLGSQPIDHPIGRTGTYQFDYSFNGNGFTVSGVNVSHIGNKVGLFGILGDGYKIESLNIEGQVTTLSANLSCGGIAGINNGTIEACNFSGTVSCAGDWATVGGIAGSNSGTIVACTFSGDVAGDDGIGGIAGVNNRGDIIACANMGGSVMGLRFNDHGAGGIAGSNFVGRIYGCYSLADHVEYTDMSSSYLRFGGIVGSVWGDYSALAVINSCYWLYNANLPLAFDNASDYDITETETFTSLDEFNSHSLTSRMNSALEDIGIDNYKWVSPAGGGYPAIKRK